MPDIVSAALMSYRYDCNILLDVTSVPKAVVPGRIYSSGLSVEADCQLGRLSAEADYRQKRIIGKGGLSEFRIREIELRPLGMYNCI
jgi:hypothetical protein